MAYYRREYGILTAVSIVVGSVIGSGVFFKTESVNKITDGSIPFSVTAWAVGASVMILCLLTFALIARNTDTDGGMYAIAENLVGKGYARIISRFMSVIYYPSLISVLSYLTAKYTLITLGGESAFLCGILSAFFLVTAFLQNAFLPKISGKVQVTTTIIKLIPLLIMIALGIPKGELSQNLSYESTASLKTAFFPSVTATLFAYEGWISATSVGKNLKNSRKNLPLALVVGGVIISVVYILYYLGIMGTVRSTTLINYGTQGIKMAFTNVMGRWGNLLTAFVAVSCYGALNALVMGIGHAEEKKHVYFKGATVSLVWLSYLLGQQSNVLSSFRFDSTELPVVTIYLLYIPIFIGFARKEKKTKSIILCIGGILASLFAVVCGVLAHYNELVSYTMILFAIFLLCKKKTSQG